MSDKKIQDAGPDTQTQRRNVNFDGSDEDVEAHKQNLTKDAAPEGAASRRLVGFDGSDEEDVEGHSQHLKL
jgi:hypothetical protein